MKKLMALILSVAMVLCAIPMTTMTAFADGTISNTASDTVTVTGIPTAAQTYTGAPIEPTVTVTNTTTSTVLTKDTDYTVTYEKNTDAGAATVIVEGKGAYSGKYTGNFTIEPKTLTDVTFTVPPQGVGPASTTKIFGAQVKDGATLLKEGEDYDITFGSVDLSSVGSPQTATATITLKGNYAGGPITKTDSFNVVKGDLSKAKITVSGTYTYTGAPISPSVTVTTENGATVPSSAYTLALTNNTNAGTAALITVTAPGSSTAYTGSKSQAFTINKASLSSCVITLTKDTYTYTGSPITPTYTVKLGSYTLLSTDYVATLTNNVNTGKAKLTLKGAGNNFDSATSKEAEFTITGTGIDNWTVTLDKDSYPYTGKAIEPVVTVKDGATTLVKGTSYNVEYKDNINAGTGTVIITGAGKYSGTKEVTFKIKGIDNAITTTSTTYKKYPTSGSFSLAPSDTSGKAGFTYLSSDESVLSVSDTGVVTVKGVGVATITISTKGTTNYDPATKVVSITVVPKKPQYKLTSTAKKKIKVTITPVTGATRYQIRYGRTGVYKNVYTSNKTRTISYLKSGKNYYVKLRSYTKLSDGSIVWGNWTTVKKIKVK